MKKRFRAIALLLLGGTFLANSYSETPREQAARESFPGAAAVRAFIEPVAEKKLAEIQTLLGPPAGPKDPAVELFTVFDKANHPVGVIAKVPVRFGGSEKLLQTSISLGGRIVRVELDPKDPSLEPGRFAGAGLGEIMRRPTSSAQPGDGAITFGLKKSLLYYYACFGKSESLVAILADTEKVYLPVAPEPEYPRRRNLMADGLMPNYKSVWYSVKRNDLEKARLALQYMNSLAKQSARFSPPTTGGTVDDFRKRIDDLIQKTSALDSDLRSLGDRSAVASRILAIYQTCQGCHEVYAPDEGKDKRKYSPPL